MKNMNQYEKAMLFSRKEKSLPEKLLRIPREELFLECDTLLEDSQRIQIQILMEIVDRAQMSAYGKAHKFNEVNDIESWQQKIPISTYQDYSPYIQAEMNGTEHQLYDAATEVYILTTGSTGKAKYFMESAAGSAAKLLVMAMRGMYMSQLLPVTRDMEAKNLTISNYAQVGKSSDGKSILRASGQTARNLRKKTGTMNIIPENFWEVPNIDPETREYMIGVLALAEPRFSKVFCNNLYSFGRVLDQIKNNSRQMIEDIRIGCFSCPVDKEIEDSLNKLVFKNSDRANVLEGFLRDRESLIESKEDIHKIWPQLQMVSCWLSGTVGRDAREVLRRLPSKIRCFDMGYGASEGKLNIPTALAEPAGFAALFSVFYEFLPLDKKETPLCMWEVEIGKCYELIITTYSGLYRYNMLDIVRIVGFIGKTPKFVFCGKSTDCVEIKGNKIYGYQISDLIYEIECTQGYSFDLVQVFVEKEHINFIINSKDKFDKKEFKSILDEKLAFFWKIKCKKIYIVDDTYKMREFDKRIRKDRGACGIKLPVIIEQIPDLNNIIGIIT